MTNTSTESIEEALNLLEQTAEQTKDELKAIVSDKYPCLRTLIMENGSTLMESLTTAKDNTLHAANRAKDAGIAKACELSQAVDTNVHQNPWPYIAGSAAVGMLLGFILHRSRE